MAERRNVVVKSWETPSFEIAIRHVQELSSGAISRSPRPVRVIQAPTPSRQIAEPIAIRQRSQKSWKYQKWQFSQAERLGISIEEVKKRESRRIAARYHARKAAAK
jgi:hypothetical protein